MSLSKNKKWIIGLAVLGVLIAYGVFSFIYKPHAQIEDLKVTFEGTAAELIKEASSDELSLSNAIVAVTGTVSDIQPDGFTLDNSVFCQWKTNAEPVALQYNKPCKIKGRFIGYDDLLEEARLDQVIIYDK